MKITIDDTEIDLEKTSDQGKALILKSSSLNEIFSARRVSLPALPG